MGQANAVGPTSNDGSFYSFNFFVSAFTVLQILQSCTICLRELFVLFYFLITRALVYNKAKRAQIYIQLLV